MVPRCFRWQADLSVGEGSKRQTMAMLLCVVSWLGWLNDDAVLGGVIRPGIYANQTHPWQHVQVLSCTEELSAGSRKKRNQPLKQHVLCGLLPNPLTLHFRSKSGGNRLARKPAQWLACGC